MFFFLTTVAVPLIIGALVGTAAAIPTILSLKRERAHLRHSRALNWLDAVAATWKHNTEVYNKKSGHPTDTKNAYGEVAAYTAQGNAALRSYLQKLKAVVGVARRLKKIGAVSMDWEDMKRSRPEDIVVRPVKSRFLRRTLVAREDVPHYENYLRGMVRSRNTVEPAIAAYSPPDLGLPEITLDDVEKKGRLPDSKRWMDTLLSGYPSDVADVAKRNGWHGFILSVLGVAKSPRIRVASAVRRVLRSPYSHPGGDPGSKEEKKTKREERVEKKKEKAKRKDEKAFGEVSRRAGVPGGLAGKKNPGKVL
ncbi:hypothetical protein J0910_18985 [Nocardiopsis sp. CNT-189]|uniref:hypothetical protein n=1 Tax=Nocardiopsis oceanisediminis TaxID=2816862 RepID=UPI003B319088